MLEQLPDWTERDYIDLTIDAFACDHGDYRLENDPTDAMAMIRVCNECGECF